MPQGLLGRAPANTKLSTPGATPLSAITAILARDALAVSSGSIVPIVGATGGVGSFATQLAAHLGATVIAPALPEVEHYLPMALPDGVFTQRDRPDPAKTH